MAAEPVSKTISVPLSSAVWTAKTTVYKYDRSTGFGLFEGTKNATIFAPESGTVTLLGDGTWLLKADVPGGVREWIGVSKLANITVKTGTFVKVGTPLGVAAEDFALSLNQSIDNKSTQIDPVPFFLMAHAGFVDAPQPQAQPRPTGAEPPRATDPAALPHTPNSEIAVRPPEEIAAPPKMVITGKHLFAVAIGGLGLGALVAYNVRRR